MEDAEAISSGNVKPRVKRPKTAAEKSIEEQLGFIIEEE
jgi:hypothetical protein